MSKKIWISLIILIILAAIAGGFFWRWEYYKETPPSDWGSVEISEPENYIVKETAEGKFVENKKDGLRLEIPENWTVQKPTQMEGGGSIVQLFSPLAIKKDSVTMENGCRINIDITYIKTNIETLKKEIQENSLLYSFIKTIEPIEVQGKEGLRYTAESSMENFKFYRDEISLLVKNKMYSLALDTTLEEKKHCSQEFDKFLETVSID